MFMALCPVDVKCLVKKLFAQAKLVIANKLGFTLPKCSRWSDKLLVPTLAEILPPRRRSRKTKNKTEKTSLTIRLLMYQCNVAAGLDLSEVQLAFAMSPT
jgi:hypothetical protein